MTAAVALIRAINLGGRNMIRMEALRGAHESLGLLDVQTYVQSGNVVFRAKPRELKNLERRIEEAIEKGHGFRPGVVVRTASELREAVARNPFAGRKAMEPAKLLVVFLIAEPETAAAEKLRAIKDVPEEFHLIGRELYIYFPNGQGRSKFPPLVERTLKTPGTGRNWNTVTRLLEMAEALEG